MRRAHHPRSDQAYDDEAYERLADRLEERGDEPRDERGDERGDERREQRRDQRRRETLPPVDIAKTAMRRVTELTGRQPSGVTRLEPADDGWAVEAEVVEDRRIPSSGDILAVYRIGLRPDGSLVSLRRVRRYPRGKADSGEVT
ncbi:gas vesicle protein GvpO [Dactylosporangium sp. NPDC049525]|uniref:gas vesicle protein GvpO n=1 Tax=Dactylosporangium sp. NPDC049525 TaxID=3154730 RepID=UPI00342317EF